MAWIAVRVSGGSESQASITWASSGVIGAFAVSSAVECAVPSSKSTFSPELRQSSRFDVHRQGLDQDIVYLSDQKQS